jgi:REP element-mobilizing transposase RayT
MFVRTLLTSHQANNTFQLMPNPDLHSLPRLERSCYQAFAAVHWTMRVEPPIPGWLTDHFHRDFRVLLLHACVREQLFCPAYCLMPDHFHLMWLGLSRESDQLNGMKFLRTYLNRLLAGTRIEDRKSAADSRPQPQAKWKLQPQAHDHVLREEEREQDAFARVCFYILANPVRAELATSEPDWPFSGTVVPGYPDLYPFQEDFWELFWKLYGKHREPAPTGPPEPE